jgi:hypothetical protein
MADQFLRDSLQYRFLRVYELTEIKFLKNVRAEESKGKGKLKDVCTWYLTDICVRYTFDKTFNICLLL